MFAPPRGDLARPISLLIAPWAMPTFVTTGRARAAKLCTLPMKLSYITYGVYTRYCALRVHWYFSALRRV